ncbi:MAG: 16S rRNA (adenine(1518)-N(6)/adenine(1519)-N(6))-dimethyltransferase RsmA [bacterium]
MPDPSVHALLKKYSIRPKKRLGQHFLVAGPTIDKVVRCLDLSSDDTVLEIGPGLGVMTRRIAGRARRVIAVERDERMVAICREELADLANVEVVEADILEFDPALYATADQRIKVAGNLPYNISTPILFWMLKNKARISSAVVMLQREVAERIAAKPGGKEYGRLSVMMQAQAAVEKLFDISAASFAPRPEVVSSVIRIDFPEKDGLAAEELSGLEKTVRQAFGKRRKTIKNALLGAEGSGASAAEIEEKLLDAGIDPKARPEQIPVENYKRLARSF